MADRLILAAHDAERHDGAPVLGHETGNQRVQRPLARRDRVRMAWLDAKARPAVVEQHAASRRHHGRTKRVSDRIDQRAGIAITIDHAEVDRVRVHRRTGHLEISGAIEPDARRRLGRKVVRQQLLDIDVDQTRIAERALAHQIGVARRLGFEMEPLDAHRPVAAELERGKQVEHHQHRDAGTVGRALPHLASAVRREDRHDLFGSVRGEIIQRMQAAGTA